MWWIHIVLLKVTVESQVWKWGGLFEVITTKITSTSKLKTCKQDIDSRI